MTYLSSSLLPPFGPVAWNPIAAPGSPSSGLTEYFDSTYSLLATKRSTGDVAYPEPWPKRHFHFETHFEIGTAAGACLAGSNGAGSTTQAATGDATHPGIADIILSTSTVGVWSGASAILLGGAAWEYDALIQIPTLSTGVDRFTFYYGFIDSATAESVDGVYVSIVDNVNSGKFQFNTSSNSVRTTADTGLTAVAGTWYRIHVSVNAAGTSASCTINGANGATITTNIPTGAGRETGFGICGVKSAGTNFRRTYCDWMFVDSYFTSDVVS